MNATIEAMISGAVQSGAVEPTGLASVWKRKYDASQRRKAQRLLEKAALQDVRAQLEEAEEQLRPATNEKLAFDQARSEMDRAETTVAELNRQHEDANQAVNHAVASNDSAAMETAVARERNSARLVEVAADQATEKKSALEACTFDEDDFARQSAKVEQLRTATKSGKAALALKAEQVAVTSRVKGAELAAIESGFSAFFASLMHPVVEAEAFRQEATYARDHAQPFVSSAPPTLADVVAVGLDNVARSYAPMAQASATKGAGRPRNTEYLMGSGRRKGARKSKRTRKQTPTILNK